MYWHYLPCTLRGQYWVGHFRLPTNVLSVMPGGHARSGMEDNLYCSRGRKLESNAEAVARIARIAREMKP